MTLQRTSAETSKALKKAESALIVLRAGRWVSAPRRCRVQAYQPDRINSLATGAGSDKPKASPISRGIRTLLWKPPGLIHQLDLVMLRGLQAGRVDVLWARPGLGPWAPKMAQNSKKSWRSLQTTVCYSLSSGLLRHARVQTKPLLSLFPLPRV